jgi:hypothetical protein
VNHQRHVIREALVALLAAGGTAAGSRVYDHPYDPRTVFPALSVTDVGEQQSADSMPADSGRPVERVYTLEVAAEVQQTTNYARTRDQLLADVEAIFASAALTITALKSVTPAGYAPLMDMTGDRPIAIGRQRFDVLYFTPQGNPSTSL